MRGNRARREDGLGAVVDAVLPGADSALARNADHLHEALSAATKSPAGAAAAYVLRGNEWLGHPAHPLMVMVPVGAWTVTGWFDLRGATTGDSRFDEVADGALRVGILAALPAAVTGVAQFLDADGAARRETALHAALNNVALALFTGSLALRRRGRRSLGRRLASVGHLVVGVSGFLGSDLSYRHGMGVRPQAVKRG